MNNKRLISNLFFRIRKTFLSALALTSLLSFISCGSPKKVDGAELFDYCGDINWKSEKNAEVSAAENQSENLEKDWWKKSSFYHIWVKSFKNSKDFRCGDFKGIESKLDYIQNTVGCDAIWLSPVFDTIIPGYTEIDNLHGYNIKDYYKVNYAFSDQSSDSYTENELAQDAESDLVDLIKACHQRGIKIIFDYVPNHSSSQNSWFTDSAAGGSKRKWYLWNSKQLFWNNTMNTDNWYQNNSSWYYGAFGSGMPDLNYYNYEVREEMKNVVRYWLNKGFDGIRIDAIRYLQEEVGKYADTDSSNKWFTELRNVINQYSSPKFMVCENWITNNRTMLEKPFGNGSEFNMVFDFDQGNPCISSVKGGKDMTGDTIRGNPSESESYGTFMANHDEYCDRLGTALGGDYKMMNQATALSLLRPTVPFIYYGQELGMKNLSQDGDIRLRGNFDWTLEQTEESQTNSPLKLNAVLLKLRKDYSDFFAYGKVTKLQAKDDSTLAYLISYGEKKLLCFYNFSSASVSSAEFTGNDVSENFEKSSVLIGSAQPLAVSGKTVTVTSAGPYSYRVYSLSENSVENRWNDETYNPNQTYNPTDVMPSYVYIPDTMYIRGSFNSWGGYKMSITTDNDTQRTWSVNIKFSDSGSISYKYCINDGSTWGINWGSKTASDSYGNIQQTVTGNITYTFSFTIFKKDGSYSYNVTAS